MNDDIRQFFVGKKDKALLLLKKKKFQEGLIDKTESQLETIEQLVRMMCRPTCVVLCLPSLLCVIKVHIGRKQMASTSYIRTLFKV